MSKTVLALDLATCTGWALGRGWDMPRFGAERLPGFDMDDLGRVYSRFDLWLSDMVTMHRPDHLVMEAPLATRGPGQNAARLLLGLAAVTELVVYRRDLDVIEVQSATVRKHFCGSGWAKKDDVGFACRQRGWAVTDHNAADALAVLDWARHALKLPGAPALGAA